MKIQYTTPINNRYSSKIKYTKNTEKNNKSLEIPMISNSLAEAIGRSQIVSFSGENRIKGTVFEHSCSEFLGDKENIYYNKQDGSFRHTVVGRDGQLKRQEEFYPQERKEITTKVINGIKTTTTISPYMHKIERYNEDGEQIFYEKIDSSSKETIITDFEVGRRIISKEKNGIKSVQVIDLKTNSTVTTGDLVLQRVYDEKTDSYITENIITGQILKREKFRPNNKYDSIIEYSPRTGKVIREYMYDAKTGGYFDCTYYESGARKRLVKLSRDGRKENTYDFLKDGKTILRHILLEMDKKGNLQCETVYIPGTDLIDTQTFYEEESCTKYFFKRTPNIPHSAEHYQDGKLVEEIKFQKDGESYEYSKEYKQNGSVIENFFNRNGDKIHSKFYTSDNFLYQYAEYNPKTDELIRTVDFDRLSGNIKETIYDELTGYAKKIIISTSNGKTREVREFYKDSKQIKIKIEYNFDGSYFYTRYDETGSVIKREEYNADGTKKEYHNSNGRDWYRNYYNSEPQKQKRKETAISEEDVIEHILSVTSSSVKDIHEITQREWEKMAEILGIENPNDLISLNKETYRKLSKRFHPDLLQGEEKKEYGEKIFKIIQNLYTNAGRGTHI